MPPKYKSKTWLEKRFVDEDTPISDMADECGVVYSTIDYWLGKFNLKQRFTADEKYNDEDWLRKKHLGEALSSKEIADLDGVDVGSDSIAMRLSEFDINGTGSGVDFVNRATSAGVPKSSKHLNAQWLEKRYIKDELTVREIAKLDGVEGSPSSVNRALNAFDIDTRESLSVRGEDNPMYKHGEGSHNYGTDWRRIAKQIRKRDGYECQNCEKTQRETLELFDRKLDVHHIKPLSEFDSTESANDPDNLKTLCRSCHRRIEMNTP